ncbi:MAG: galactose mutarotase [Saprospiraceae bacterium]|nr:galactose mutarotase [Saprospiraceae bacterium]
MNWKKSLVGSVGSKNIYQLECTNIQGQTVQILNYGGIVHRWLVPLKHNGTIHDILLGKDDLAGYMSDQANFGCIIGRYANRISEGNLVIGDHTFLLSRNLNGHHLHGGFDGFGKKVWNISDFYEETDSATILLTYESPDGEEGYPGNLKTEVRYTFTDQNELIIRFKAESDKDTVCNLTNHNYFNLGNKTDILDHELQIMASQITETDNDLIPTGRLKEVKNTVYDFLQMRPIDWREYQDIDSIKKQNGYDNNFITQHRANYEKHPVAIIRERKNNLKLEVYSSKPGLQLYTGNWLEGIQGKNNTTYKNNAGLCLESQFYPDSPNQPTFPEAKLIAGQTYHHYLKYKLI